MDLSLVLTSPKESLEFKLYEWSLFKCQYFLEVSYLVNTKVQWIDRMYHHFIFVF